MHAPGPCVDDDAAGVEGTEFVEVVVVAACAYAFGGDGCRETWAVDRAFDEIGDVEAEGIGRCGAAAVQAEVGHGGDGGDAMEDDELDVGEDGADDAEMGDELGQDDGIDDVADGGDGVAEGAVKRADAAVGDVVENDAGDVAIVARRERVIADGEAVVAVAGR